MKSHLLHLLLYSALVSTFFGTLARPTVQSRVRLGVVIWLAMVGGTLLLAWIMYPFPR